MSEIQMAHKQLDGHTNTRLAMTFVDKKESLWLFESE